MIIKKEINWYDIEENCWSGARQVMEKIKEQGREKEAMEIIELEFLEVTPTDTQVNDFIWFDLDGIMHLWDEE